MSFSVNTNGNALAAIETLNLTQQQMSRVQGEVSSGYAVNSAAADASTFAIAQQQRGSIAGFQSISTSLGMGTALTNVALQGAQTISNLLNQIEAKVIQAEDPSQNATLIGTAVTALISQVTSTALAANFNGVNLISASTGSTAAGNQTVLSSLNGTGTSTAVAFITLTGQGLNATSLGINSISITSAATASAALSLVLSAASTVQTALADLGTSSNQIQTQTNFVTTLTNSLTTGVGDLVDANLASASAQLQALQTKQQLGIQALSIANQGPSAILALFR